MLTEKSKKEWEDWMKEKKQKERNEKEEGIKMKEESKCDNIEKKNSSASDEVEKKVVDDSPHDTVGLICMDSQGRLACGTSTSGYVRFFVEVINFSLILF